MRKTNRIAQTLVVSLILCSGLVMAQADATSANKDTSAEHHSRFSKMAFWKHHKDSDKNSKQAQTKQTPKDSQAKTAQAKPAPSKPAAAKTAQVKTVSAKQTSSKADQKPAEHATSNSKPVTKKTPSTVTTRPQPKTQDPKAASLVKQ